MSKVAFNTIIAQENFFYMRRSQLAISEYYSEGL